MRISASYNYFNGDEHFLASLRAIRPAIEHISVVWQEISNAGEPITKEASAALMQGLDLGLIDEVIHFVPDLSGRRRKQNEIAKRAVGLEAARRADASHFLSMDADEFYRTDELVMARELIAKHGWRSTSVSSFLHCRRPIWRALDCTNCCFVTEIRADSVMGFKPFPYPRIDPSRRMTADTGTHYHFGIEQIAMYHMNFVRRDMAQKLRNSSNLDQEFLNIVGEAVANWNEGEALCIPNKDALYFERVSNEFNTYDPG